MTIVRRFWLDAEGRPRVEEAEWRPAPPADPPIGAELTLEAPYELEGDPIAGRVVLVALTGTAADPDQLAPDPHQLYAVPLREGAQLVDHPTWDTAREADAQRVADAQADVAARLASTAEQAGAERAAALGKLADSAGLTDAERAALLGEG